MVPVVVCPQVAIGALGRLQTKPVYVDAHGNRASEALIDEGKASIAPMATMNVSGLLITELWMERPSQDSRMPGNRIWKILLCFLPNYDNKQRLQGWYERRKGCVYNVAKKATEWSYCNYYI